MAAEFDRENGLAVELSRLAAVRAGLTDSAEHSPQQDGLTPDQALALADALAEIATKALDLHTEAVRTARAAGASWTRIGFELGTSRQAAQQRFGRRPPAESPDDGLHRLSPQRNEELSVLADAGEQGWRLLRIESDALVLRREPGTWEVRRASLFSPRMPSSRQGWEAVGIRFPDAYYVRRHD